MNFILGLIIGLVVGAIIGVFVSALCVASGSDRGCEENGGDEQS